MTDVCDRCHQPFYDDPVVVVGKQMVGSLPEAKVTICAACNISLVKWFSMLRQDAPIYRTYNTVVPE